ncbi:MAG: NifB/NifX family molybdenum-iron cluster-binding protein [Deltaproteobacteria bacterium]|nr:NifB/NifX family molybdenum-iron cluster-binding protein [Deltaproteobacteria bacterium]
MKVALTVWENRVSPVFDCAQRLLIVDIYERTEVSRHFEPFHWHSPYSRASKLSSLGVQVLICGAVSEQCAAIIDTRGIRIIPFMAGKVDEVLNAYLTDRLNDRKFLMPGCGDDRAAWWNRQDDVTHTKPY